MGNFDFLDGGSESIPSLEMSSVDAETSSGRETLLVLGFLVIWVRNREVNLEDRTLDRSGKSSTNVSSEASVEDTHVSERLYQLAETIGTSRTIPATLGLWALVVDAAPHEYQGYVRRFAGCHN